MFSVSVAQVKCGYTSADRMSFMLMNIFAMNSLALTWSHLGPDRGREGGKEGGREGKREGERVGKRVGREGRKEGGGSVEKEGSDIMNAVASSVELLEEAQFMQN